MEDVNVVMEDVEKQKHGLNLIEMIEEAKASYESRITDTKHIIVQRDSDRFWSVIMKQQFDIFYSMHQCQICWGGSR